MVVGHAIARRAGRCFGIAALVLSTSAYGDELDDLHGREMPVEDLAPRRVSPSEQSGDASVSLALSTRQVTLASGGDRRDYAGSIVLSMPTDLWWSAPKAKDISETDDGGRPPPPPGGARARPRPDVSSAFLLVRPRDARAAADAAVAAAGHDREREGLDDLASRARWSAALPQVRLRATRLVDESVSLSPTSYDAERTTSSGGASLWLEARTTWSLDRLVFADDEVRIERIQRQVADDVRALRERVVVDLFRWQRARVRVRDPALSYEQCVEHWLDMAELEVSLDVVTAGWLSRWRAARGVPSLTCEDFEVQHEAD